MSAGCALYMCIAAHSGAPGGPTQTPQPAHPLLYFYSSRAAKVNRQIYTWHCGARAALKKSSDVCARDVITHMEFPEPPAFI
jgi:hypothetical protein